MVGKFLLVQQSPLHQERIATGWAQSRIGAAGAGAIAEKPETAGSIIIIEAIPETLVILGFVIASMIILMVK